MFPSQEEECKYSIPHRDEMIQVLDNWKVWDREKNVKVLEKYLSDLETNKSRKCASNEELSIDYNIIQRLKSKLADDEHEYNLAHYKSLAELSRAQKNVFKSQMKDATVLDFRKSLLDLPEECLKSKAETLDFCKSLDELNIPEERKTWLLQKVVEKDITSAYDDVMESFERIENSEKGYMRQLQELSGVEYQEEDKLDEHPCTDMEAFNRLLKVMEDELEKKGDIVGQVYQTQHPARKGLLRISIKYVDMCFAMRTQKI
ncbi:hypothetical protein MKW94_029252 [Papaver nudicaule]|uniref:Uncharacterized protein n=1 Tax=Papaver nudicaule TaxID=74823 RepID=A0AA41SNE1_PAPNU|nr:hypothetical protein [Papaver nudicaule]